MKKIGLVFLMVLPLMLRGQSVGFYLDVCRFFDFQVNKTIAEFYFAVDGTTLEYQKDEDGLYQVSVNINWLLQRIDNGDSIPVMGDNYNLQFQPEERLKDTTAELRRKTLFNLQKVDLEPGMYKLQAIAYDRYAPAAQKIMAIHEFEIKALSPNQIVFSDIKWIAYEKDSKGTVGRTRDDLIPLVTNDAFINQDSLVFYQEIYNTDDVLDQNFTVRSRFWQGDNILYAYEQTQARPPRPQRNAFREKFDIRSLKSNTYYLQVEVLNYKGLPVATYRKKFFVYNSRVETEYDNLAVTSETDIFNDYSEEQLDYYLRTLSYISTEQEYNFARALESPEQKKNFLYTFFEKRKTNPRQKILALWNGHLAALDYVNQQFKSSFREGWQTDRGRVFIKYGIPSDIERYPGESAIIPYEIWRYDRLGAQNNVIFIFYDSDLASNEYLLLHSTKYGEISNPRWKEQLQNKGLVPGTIDFERNESLQNPFNTKLNPND
ncbi:MAG: GWxTD domain-containing protein [Bacteroidia bacterium]|nr:GWxTD domain-containing protein [Bacteroidia bacterium]